MGLCTCALVVVTSVASCALAGPSALPPLGFVEMRAQAQGGTSGTRLHLLDAHVVDAHLPGDLPTAGVTWSVVGHDASATGDDVFAPVQLDVTIHMRDAVHVPVPLSLPAVGRVGLEVEFVPGELGLDGALTVHDGAGLVIALANVPQTALDDVQLALGPELFRSQGTGCVQTVHALDVTRGATHVVLDSGASADLPGTPRLRVLSLAARDDVFVPSPLPTFGESSPCLAQPARALLLERE
jgi:hypothetical protein